MQGKKIAIFYEDGDKVVRKDGTVQEQDSSWITIKTFDKTIAIPTSRVIRIEIFDGGSQQ